MTYRSKILFLCMGLLVAFSMASSQGGETSSRPVIGGNGAANPVVIKIDRSKPIGVSRFRTGVTHTQYSLDPWGDPEAIQRAKKLLRAVAVYQNQHLMGWGTDNPNPAPGVYNWESLDRRIGLIRSMGATPVITLCAAPDWMKGGEPGKTDWSKIEVAPLPEHYADFAALAKQVARRYPDVKQYQVWNEMKGFWNPKAHNWDYKNYTKLYNLVYDALKSVDPAIRVGGPYLVIEGTGSEKGDWATEKPIRARQWDVLEYWLKHKRGADFITVDRGLIDYHDKRSYTDSEAMALTDTFESVARQIRSRTGLPLWWAEFYGADRTDREFVAANYASIMLHMIRGGSAAALLWGPQDADNNLKGGLFTDTRKPDGGRPLPLYAAFKAIHDHFGPGTRLYTVSSSSPEVEALASDRKLLLVNKRPEPVTVRLNDRNLTLRRYEVRLMDVSRD
ncbi:MAG: xylan 1,4-beta-xylosidase [Armatimonadetes bacterium]|nr:xylan 1,4-beta-xylosidase [Armatimonadota bacterium]